MQDFNLCAFLNIGINKKLMLEISLSYKILHHFVCFYYEHFLYPTYGDTLERLDYCSKKTRFYSEFFNPISSVDTSGTKFSDNPLNGNGKTPGRLYAFPYLVRIG